MDLINAGQAATQQAPAPPTGPAPPRTGAFADVRARWLLVWALGGALLITGLADAAVNVFDLAIPDDALTILLYLPLVAWVVVMVGRRARVDLGVMFRWPRLGSYWGVVVGLFFLQLLFSLAAITLTQLVFPDLGDALVGVGEGNLLIAILAITIMPPLVEETVFRGVLLERYAVKWRIGVGIVVSAIFFGLLHVDPVGAGMFGVITGLLYLRTRSLWPGILIHAANNGFVLVVTRTAGAESDAAEATLTESLTTAGVLLAISVPFLAWFIVRTWPTRTTPTPYQHHEMTTGLPPRTISALRWSAVPGEVGIEVSSTRAQVADLSGAPLAVLPLDRVRAVYPTETPAGMSVVVLLHDGSWTTLQPLPGDPKRAKSLTLALSERVQFQLRPASTAQAGVVAGTQDR